MGVQTTVDQPRCATSSGLDSGSGQVQRGGKPSVACADHGNIGSVATDQPASLTSGPAQRLRPRASAVAEKQRRPG